jgi:hypothetical protein
MLSHAIFSALLCAGGTSHTLRTPNLHDAQDTVRLLHKNESTTPAPNKERLGPLSESLELRSQMLMRPVQLQPIGSSLRQRLRVRHELPQLKLRDN